MPARRHDLLTPLNQIIGYSELLQEEVEDGGDPARFVPDLKKIAVAARTLQRLHEENAPQPSVPPPGYQADHEDEEPRSVHAPDTIRGALLVVDDEESNRDMLSRRLRSRGYLVTTANDGNEALAALEATAFDLVLLDVMMPGISGLTVLKTVRKTRTVSDLPIIMSTALDQGQDVAHALRLGANDYVTKPLDMQVVIARVGTQISLKRANEKIRQLAADLETRNQVLQKIFGRYLSDDIVASLLSAPDGLELGGKKQVVTLLMSDLRSFSTMAERMAPEQVVRLLNNYLGTMADVITEHHGTIDEFIGDGIFALFGAPTTAPDDVARAATCALSMQAAISRVNERNREDGLPDVAMGLALHTGEVVVGNIGSTTRTKYGVVGSHVNLTARIESFTVGGQVLISEATRHALEGAAITGDCLQVRAKGFSDLVTIHELLGLEGRPDLQRPALPRRDSTPP